MSLMVALAEAIHDRLAHPKTIADADLLDAGIALLGRDHPLVIEFAHECGLDVPPEPED